MKFSRNLFLILLLLLSSLASAQENAYDFWVMLKESEATLKANEITVINAHPDAQLSNGTAVTGVSYGAEKEGSSSVITRIMGPNSDHFLDYIEALPEESQKQFLAEFLDGYSKGRYRNRDVKDVIDNVAKNMDLAEFRGLNYFDMSLEDLKAKFNKFLELSEDRPFSFITKGTRQKIFNGKLAGQTGKFYSSNSYPDYDKWTVNFGEAQKYISDAHGTSTGWELNFKPQQTYGDFETMIGWFKQELNKNGKLFEAPGHQRLVFPRPNLTGDALSKFDNHMKEMFRSIQSYIIMKELSGNTGLEFSNYKSVFNDVYLKSEYDEWGGSRGIIRLENRRWGENTFGVELRTGTKTPTTQRFMEQVITSRVASGDFGPIAKLDDYTLIPENLHDKQKIASRLNLEVSDVEKFYEKLETFQNSKGRGVKKDVLAPLYHWENAPYISKDKAKQIKDLSADWIKFVANEDNMSVKDFKKSLQTWARGSNITQDLESYLSPMHQYNPGGNPGKFKVAAGAIDVNKIDLGIEYSGRFPIKFQGSYTDELPHGKMEWISSNVDLTMEERKGYIKKVAMDLKKRLNPGAGSRVTEIVEENAHGHGLSIAYEFEDKKGKTWRLEWDGIGRSYTEAGDIIEGSARSGHIELVTPKFKPTYKEMESVYAAFDKFNVIPSKRMGGGHINIDLKAFEGKPKQLARFLSIYHENRGVMSMMFQDYSRYKSAEAIPISNNLANQLKNFDGSEDDLKKLLYNEGYFNNRVGRKTRYVGLDMSAYFQDVIPEEFIHMDFDISNPNEIWREQFRVEPKIRKMEFRMFNAPRSAYESALQTKLVRAMLDKALNDDDALSGIVQNVDYEKFARDPEYANEALEKMCRELGLDANEYKVFLNEGIASQQLYMKSPFYKTIDQKLADFPKVNTFKRALDTPRTVENAIASEGRIWREGEDIVDSNGRFKPYITTEAQQHYKTRKLALANADEAAELKRMSSGAIFARNKCSSYFRPAR